MMRWALVALAVLALGLAGCGAPEPTLTVQKILATGPLGSPAPTATPTASPRPTSTPLPTPVPTATPAPPATPTPGPAWPYAAPPQMTIDPSHAFVATFETAKGDIRVELFAAKAPITVNNFVFLARAGFYDGTVFHRVLASFMAQGGDPTGTGRGTPGYRFADEFDLGLRHDKPGILSMANSGPDTNGSQFFLTFVPTPHLDGVHSVFGQVTAGMDVLLNLTLRDPNASPAFPGDALRSVVIEESSG